MTLDSKSLIPKSGKYQKAYYDRFANFPTLGRGSGHACNIFHYLSCPKGVRWGWENKFFLKAGVPLLREEYHTLATLAGADPFIISSSEGERKACCFTFPPRLQRGWVRKGSWNFQAGPALKGVP